MDSGAILSDVGEPSRNQELAYRRAPMANNEAKWRHVDRGDFVAPLPDNSLNHSLAKYGILPTQIAGRFCNAADFIKDERFKDYAIYIYGVSQDEELPHPQLFWQDEDGAGYYCWQIQIYWQASRAYIEATWSEEIDPYDVVTRWGDLSRLEISLVTAMDEGMNLLLFIIDRMTKSTRGGRRNVKVADRSDDIKRALGKRYVELREQLTNVRQLAKLSEKGWREAILPDDAA
jgi:hypothetical protein